MAVTSAGNPMTASIQTTKALKSLGEFTLSNLITMGLQYGLRIAKNVIFTRLLGPSGRGIYGLITTIPELIVSFGSLGFGLGSGYLVVKKKYEVPKVLGNAMVYVLFHGLILLGIGVVIFSFKDLFRGSLDVLEQFSVIVLVAIPLRLSYGLGLDLLVALKDIHYMNTLLLGFSAIPLVLMILLWFLTGEALQAAVYAWVSSLIVISICAFLRIYWKGGSRPRVSLPYMKEAFSFGFRGNVSMFANAMVRRIDLLFIAYYMGLEAVGYYAAAISIIELLLTLPTAISAPFLPIRLELDQNTGQSLSQLVMKYVPLVMLIVCGLTMLMGKLVIVIMYGERFLPAFDPLKWLLPGVLALTLYQFLKVDIFNLNRPGFLSWVSVLTMVCNVILNYLLIPPYGISGAAIASSISYIMSTMILLVFFVHQTGLSFSDVLILRKKDFRVLTDRFKSSINDVS